jgi:hypothetical protein
VAWNDVIVPVGGVWWPGQHQLDVAAAEFLGRQVVQDHLGLNALGNQIRHNPGLVKMKIDWVGFLYIWPGFFCNIELKIDLEAEQRIVAAERAKPVPAPMLLAYENDEI